MEQIRQDAADCDARKVEQAKRMSSRDRFFAGAELFDDACLVSLAGLKASHPDWSERALRAEMKRLIEAVAKLGL